MLQSFKINGRRLSTRRIDFGRYLAQSRGQTLAQMALAWVLRHKIVTSALIGASKVQQVDDCVGVVKNLNFSAEELALIESILSQ